MYCPIGNDLICALRLIGQDFAAAIAQLSKRVSVQFQLLVSPARENLQAASARFLAAYVAGAGRSESAMARLDGSMKSFVSGLQMKTNSSHRAIICQELAKPAKYHDFYQAMLLRSNYDHRGHSHQAGLVPSHNSSNTLMP